MTRKLIIEPTSKTPKVVFNLDSYTFQIEGRSIPEDSVGFYRKVFQWLDMYGDQLTGEVIFEFKLEYFNTSSSKCILDVFKILGKLHANNPSLKAIWYVEDGDDDMLDTGNDYKDIVDVPMEIVVQ